MIQPASTDEVYVPQYDPWVVYRSPLAVFPGWSPHPGLYGPGIALDWDLGSDYSPATAGVGTTGDVIGMVAGPSSTTKASSRIVEAS